MKYLHKCFDEAEAKTFFNEYKDRGVKCRLMRRVGVGSYEGRKACYDYWVIYEVKK